MPNGSLLKVCWVSSSQRVGGFRNNPHNKSSLAYCKHGNIDEKELYAINMYNFTAMTYHTMQSTPDKGLCKLGY